MRILEAIREAGLVEKVRYYQASSSEMYGKVQEVPQVETTPFLPRSPYACAKVYAHWLTVNYRESYNMHTKAVEYSSIMNLQEEVKPSLPAKLPEQLLVLSWAFRKAHSGKSGF